MQLGDIAFDPKPLAHPGDDRAGKRFLGLPYTWGGTSSFGYDCSGFTQMLCRRRGINMPRDAQPQADWSGVVPVERKDLQPGDLLYFGSSDKKITHTGMYIGDGKFINATTHETPDGAHRQPRRTALDEAPGGDEESEMNRRKFAAGRGSRAPAGARRWPLRGRPRRA